MRTIPTHKITILLKTRLCPRIRKRLKVLLFYAKGLSVKTISKYVQMTYQSILDIINRYDKYGLSRILYYKTGKKPILSDKQMKIVASWLGNPHSVDFFYTKNDCERLIPRIKDNWGIRVKWYTLYQKLRKYEFGL